MVLVDTSVWIDHLRLRETTLEELLGDEKVMCHSFVLGELALGSLPQRETTISLLDRLPKAEIARDDEVMLLIANQKMHQLGIGYVDAHLLASAQITADVVLWTRDKQLDKIARRLGLSFEERVQ